MRDTCLEVVQALNDAGYRAAYEAARRRARRRLRRVVLPARLQPVRVVADGVETGRVCLYWFDTVPWWRRGAA